jgi:hypothetical protein
MKMPFEALRESSCQTEEEFFAHFPDDNFPPLPDEPEELPLYPSDMAYKITVYYDSTRDFTEDKLEQILADARAQYPDRTVHLEYSRFHRGDACSIFRNAVSLDGPPVVRRASTRQRDPGRWSDILQFGMHEAVPALTSCRQISTKSLSPALSK